LRFAGAAWHLPRVMDDRTRALARIQAWSTAALARSRAWGTAALTRVRALRIDGPAVTSWTLLSPWAISFALFGLFPFVFSLAASFSDYSPIHSGHTRWVGLSNYGRALTDPAFWGALGNTAFFVLGTIPFTTALALLLALAVQPAFRGRTLFRVGFFVPSVVSIVVLSLVFKGLYAPDGPLNAVLRALGLRTPAWLLDPATALPAIMAMDVWSASGYYMVIFLAGLEAIPRDLYDAARLEGATGWDCLTSITLPLLRPTLLFVLVVNTVRSLQIFAEVFVMTRGGPLHRTTTVVYYLYEEAFYRFNLGYACAVAYLLFLLTLVLAEVQLRLVGKPAEAAR
jgi:multiple sugar transport system permease protein